MTARPWLAHGEFVAIARLPIGADSDGMESRGEVERTGPSARRQLQHEFADAFRSPGSGVHRRARHGRLARRAPAGLRRCGAKARAAFPGCRRPLGGAPEAARGRAKARRSRASQMPSFVLPDETGRLVRLEELLQQGPLAITFHRGHWCPYCRINTRALAEAQGRDQRRRRSDRRHHAGPAAFHRRAEIGVRCSVSRS